MKVVLKTAGANINGIVYTPETLKAIAESLKDKELIGENNAPKAGAGFKRNSIVDLSNAACVIKNIEYQDGKLFGDVTITDPTIEKLIDLDMPYSFGLRGVGEFKINEAGDKYVSPDNFKVITFDLITDPETIWPPLDKEQNGST